MSKQQNKQPRPYKRITAETVAQHLAAAAIHGNNTAAVRATDPEYNNISDRAYRIQRQAEDMLPAEYIENTLQQIGAEAIERVGDMVNSDDERIATKNSHYVLDHIRGKAVQRSFNVNAKANIQSVLD